MAIPVFWRQNNGMPKTAVFGGGCFWCTEAVFQMLKGVSKVEPGYAGGEMENPSYERVSEGNTGHAEVIRVTYDPAVITYEDLLMVFWLHDPTTRTARGTTWRALSLRDFITMIQKTVADDVIGISKRVAHRRRV